MNLLFYYDNKKIMTPITLINNAGNDIVSINQMGFVKVVTNKLVKALVGT